MKRATTSFLIVILAFGVVNSRFGYAEECQSGCSCAITDKSRTVTCHRIPDSISSTTSNLTVIGSSLFEFETTSVASFVSLQTLVLNDLEISSIKHEQTSGITLDQLQTLSLSNNRMSRLVANVFSWCPNVEELRLSSNGIKTIDEYVFAGLKFLKTLDLANNNLEANNFIVPFSLEVFDLSNNQIVEMERIETPQLRELSLCGNQFSNPSSLVNCDLRQVTSLCMGDSITSIDPHSFSNMLDINRLEMVGKTLLTVQLMDEIKVLDQLQVLTLSFFRFEQVTAQMFRGFNQLVELHLDNIEAEKIDIDRDAFKPLCNLQFLDLRGSSTLAAKILSTENLTMLETVRNLSLRETKLTTIDSKILFRLVPKLNSLDISLNPIECNDNMRDLVREIRQRSELSMINIEETKCDNPSTLRGQKVFENSFLTRILNEEQRQNATEDVSITKPTNKTINFIMRALGLTLEHLFYIVIGLLLSVFVLVAVVLALWSSLTKKSHHSRRNGSSEGFVRADNEYTFDNFTLSETMAECRRSQSPKQSRGHKISYQTN